MPLPGSPGEWQPLCGVGTLCGSRQWHQRPACKLSALQTDAHRDSRTHTAEWFAGGSIPPGQLNRTSTGGVIGQKHPRLGGKPAGTIIALARTSRQKWVYSASPGHGSRKWTGASLSPVGGQASPRVSHRQHLAMSRIYSAARVSPVSQQQNLN